MSGNHNFNTKYTGKYNGVTYKSALKVEGNTIISFTTTKAATLTIVQSLTSNDTKYTKVTSTLAEGGTKETFTGSATNRVDNTTDKVGVYTIQIKAGKHEINRTGEYGIMFISVEEADASKVGTPTIAPTWGQSFGDPTSVTITCSATEGASIYYTLDGTTPSSSSTAYSGAFNVTSDCTVKAIAVKDGMSDSQVASQAVTINNLRKINFDFSNVTLTQGTAQPNTTAADKATYKLPNGRLYYIEGKTQTGWNDGSKDYALGASVTMDKDYTFKPVFVDNNVALGEGDATVNWTFATKEGAPSMAFEGNIGYYAAQTTVGGKKLDVVMKINTTQDAGIEGARGKCNTTSADNRAQVNKGTVFTIPAVKGMVITYTGTSGTPKTTSVTFAGANGTVDGTKVKYTYNGDAETIDIIDQGDNLYPSGLSVVYPNTADPCDLTITSDTEIEFNIDEETVKTKQITYTTSSDGKVSFSSSNTNVATVSETGLITMLRPGTTTITVSQESTETYQSGSATVEITIIENNVTGSEMLVVGDVKDKDIDIVKTAVTLPGTFIAGKSGADLTLNGVKNNGVKVRTNRGANESLSGSNTIAVSVNEGQTVTSVDLAFANNYENTVTLTGIYVDGDYTKNYLANPVVAGKDKKAVSASVSGIEAKQKIEFAVTNTPEGSVNGTQINLLAEFKYLLPTYALTINKNIEEAGTVKVTVPKGQTVNKIAEDASVTLTATPTEDYIFAKWKDSEGNTISKDATYTFSMVAENITINAIFKSKTPKVVANIETGNDEYALFTPTEDCELEDGAEAYIIKSLEGSTALIYPVEALAAGKGYLIKAATKGATVKAVETIEDPTDTEGNIITPCTTDTPLTYSPATCSRYTEGNGVLQPINYNTVIPAGQAYVEVEGRNFALFANIVDPAKTPTNVANAEAAKANGNIVKAVNGKIVVETAEGNIYTVGGAQVK